MSQNHTLEEIEAALEANAGFISQTAKVLGITYQGLYKRIKENPSLKEKLEEINERKLDFSESKLVELVREANLGAICFHLKCKGKHRGWVERSEVTGADGNALEVRVFKTKFGTNGINEEDKPQATEEIKQIDNGGVTS